MARRERDYLLNEQYSARLAMAQTLLDIHATLRRVVDPRNWSPRHRAAAAVGLGGGAVAVGVRAWYRRTRPVAAVVESAPRSARRPLHRTVLEEAWKLARATLGAMLLNVLAAVPPDEPPGSARGDGDAHAPAEGAW